MNNKNNSILKLDDNTKQLIVEISALSGINQKVVKECFEFLFISWVEKIADKPDQLVDLTIPYIGKIAVKYDKDYLGEKGELKTDIVSLLAIRDSFKDLIGNIHDEGQNELFDLLKKKIDDAVLYCSSTIPKNKI